MLHQSAHHPVVLKLMFAELGARGHDTRLLGRGLGITADALNDPRMRLSLHQANTLVARALRLAPEPALGHCVGKRRTHTSTGLLGLAMATASTLQQVLDLMTIHRRAMGNVLDVHTEVDVNGMLHLVFGQTHKHEPADLTYRFWENEAVTSTVALIRHITTREFTPHAVAWTSAKARHDQILSKFFDAPMAYGQSQARIVISEAWRHAAVPGADAVVHRDITARLEQALQLEAAPDLCATIERMIQENLASPPTLDEVANALNTSARTLRRRLTDNATSYQGLIDSVHRVHAMNRLQDPNASLSTIASELGFSDVKNFRRAFKRLTGSTPSLVREQNDAGQKRSKPC